MGQLRFLLVLAIVLGAAPVSLATTIDVPADQATIQAAVTAAAPGDTVLVSADTYVENVTIDKNITLLSVGGRAVTTIQGISSAGALGAVTVTSNTTALQIGAVGQGFTIEGIDNGNPAIENAALYFQGSHSNAQVRHNEIQANGDHGLLTEFGATISGFVIDNNLFTGQTFVGANPDGNGFADQFTQPNRPRQLVTMGGGAGGGNTSSTTFTNNDVTGTGGGYNPSAEEQGNTLATIDSNGATITGNTFAGVTSRFATGLRCRGPATTIAGNDFDSSGIEFPLKATGHVFIQSTGDGSHTVAGANTFNKQVHVDATTATIGWSIAAAAAAVGTGTTIHVGSGTYVEQVIVDGKNVTILGAGKATTFIHSPATLATAFTTGGPTPNKPVVAAMNSGNTVIDGFTIDGLGLGNANYRMQGVAFWNAGGSVTDCDILDISDSPQSGAQHGVGVYAFNNTGGPYSLEVGNCMISGYQKNAMALSGTALTVNVHDCTTVGSGDVAYIAQNGVQVSFGAGGTVANCSVSSMRYTPASTVSSGLLLYQGTSVACTNVTLVNVQESIYCADMSATVNGANISFTSSQPDYEGILAANFTGALRATSERVPMASPMLDEFGAPLLRASFTFAASNGCVTGTNLTGTAGVYAYSAGGAMTVDVSNMTITDWDYGLVADGAGTTLDATANSISGNVTAGYFTTATSPAQTAELNWWGAADGPSGDGSGSGDAVVTAGGNVSFDPWLTDGTSSTVCAFTPANNVVEPNPAAGICISGPTPCVTVPIDIDRNDNADMRAFSVTFTLSSQLMLCSGLASITEGTYLSNLPSSTTVFQVLDNGGGSYTVDGALLGLPCGQTDPSGTLFEVDVKASGGDGSGTITVNTVLLRDCANVPLPAAAGAAAIIPIDTAGPAAVANLTAVQVKTGNDTDGTTKVTLTFAVPGDAAFTQVYRAPYSSGVVNAYPEYSDLSGAGPPGTPSYPPAAPWALTGVTGTGQTDETTDRGYWYYVVFTKDDCDNVSAVSNVAGGVLNYHLGDVSDGFIAGQGNNLVNIQDMSLLGANYGVSLVFNDPVNYLDVGPTADFSVDALPNTDNVVQFEDLMMFAINHGVVSGPATIPVSTGSERPDLALRVSEGSTVTAELVLRNHVSSVKGIHSRVSFDREALELVSVTRGGVVAGAFFATVDREGGIEVDAAALGSGLTFAGEGEVATLVFRRKQEGAMPALSFVDLRGASNRAIGEWLVSGGTPGSAAPAVGATASLELLGARPNPFRGSTEIFFRLPDSRAVNVSVYDVSGRLVRTLTDQTLAAGEHRATWDGRATDGSVAGAGIYFYTFRAGETQETRKLLHVR